MPSPAGATEFAPITGAADRPFAVTAEQPALGDGLAFLGLS
ncbi:hypothetical protein PWG71_21330 [Nocardiopsis sp. N85]|nr:hypothetical protein [Nocardiopsis sp. N85]MDE3723942.1 hypothetical protein [Nocardiopsis sp. N85]